MLMCFYFLPFLAFRRLEMEQLFRPLLPPSTFCCPDQSLHFGAALRAVVQTGGGTHTAQQFCELWAGEARPIAVPPAGGASWLLPLHKLQTQTAAGLTR